MGLFSKNKKEVKRNEIPSLPKLPKLPEFHTFEDEEKLVSKLPSFPYNPLGSKFSQNTIKEAVTGKEEGDWLSDADEFAVEDEMQMMRGPLRKPFSEEIEDRFSMAKRPGKNIEEPIFVRIDKFEDALKTFNNTRKKLSEIEVVLEEIKKVREKEEGELQSWNNEIKAMKEQIEKVNRDIFSRI